MRSAPNTTAERSPSLPIATRNGISSSKTVFFDSASLISNFSRNAVIFSSSSGFVSFFLGVHLQFEKSVPP
jgi:hypothetical protein